MISFFSGGSKRYQVHCVVSYGIRGRSRVDNDVVGRIHTPCRWNKKISPRLLLNMAECPAAKRRSKAYTAKYDLPIDRRKGLR